MKSNLACVLFLFLASFAGCNTNPSADATRSSPVGVVDLDKAASELGLTQQLTDILQAEDQKLGAGLREIKQQLQAQFDAKKKLAGDTPSTKDREELQVLEMQANQMLQNYLMRSQNQLQQVRAALVKQLRLKFAESIQGVAKKHEMKVVLTSSDAVIFSVASVDITAELIEALREHSSSIKLQPPSAPVEGAPTVAPLPATTGSAVQSTTGRSN